MPGIKLGTIKECFYYARDHNLTWKSSKERLSGTPLSTGVEQLFLSVIYLNKL